MDKSEKIDKPKLTSKQRDIEFESKDIANFQSKWQLLEQWMSEHYELCQLSHSLSFSQQKASESYKSLIANSAKYGFNLIKSMSVVQALHSAESHELQSPFSAHSETQLERNSSNANPSSGNQALTLAFSGSERMGSMIPLSGFSRFEEKSMSKRTAQVSSSLHSSTGPINSSNQVTASVSQSPSQVPSKTYLRRMKKN